MNKQIPMEVSRTIHNLRFPLIILIVLMHSSLYGISIHGGKVPENSLWGKFVLLMIRDTIPNVAVPLFFVISGFLFFGTETWAWRTYLQKIKKRINTLVVPYFVWNLVAFLVFCLKHEIPSVFPRIAEVTIDFSFFSKGFFYNTAFPKLHGVPVVPFDGPLWYVRDLVFLIIISPLVFYAMKKVIVGGGNFDVAVYILVH